MVTLAGAVSSPASASASSSAASAASALSADTLSASDFIQILVAEFQNQDPTEPADPTQFASQLVEFSNLGQLQSIDSAVTPTAQTNLMQAASAFVGREVVAPGSTVGVKGGKATSIVYAPTATDNYTAQVFNAQGTLVDSVKLGNQTNGSIDTFTWQPSSSIADGGYSVQIVNSSNAALSGTLEQGVVQNVSLTGSGVTLDLGNVLVSESAVAQVAQP